VLIERYLACAQNLMQRACAWIESRKMRGWERQAWKRSILVLACSECDRDVIARYSQSDPVVAPNVIDTDAYLPHRQTAQSRSAALSDPATILFSGGMDWQPNRDAVAYFASAILPVLRTLVRSVRFVV